MQWQEIREYYPEQWLLIEAFKAHSEQGKRILDQLAVLGAFANSSKALSCYTEIHREAPDRELYVFHTSRKAIDIIERRWHGIRGLQ